MELTTQGRELLLRVKDRILEEPARIRMHEWYNGPEQMDYIQALTMHARVPPCSTVACIAGWVVIESGFPREVLDVDRAEPSWNSVIPKLAVERLFGPGHGIEHAMDYGLFHESSWPIDLENRIRPLDSGTPEYATVVAAAIDRFIADPEAF